MIVYSADYLQVDNEARKNEENEVCVSCGVMRQQ